MHKKTYKCNVRRGDRVLTRLYKVGNINRISCIDWWDIPDAYFFSCNHWRLGVGCDLCEEFEVLQVEYAS